MTGSQSNTSQVSTESSYPDTSQQTEQSAQNEHPITESTPTQSNQENVGNIVTNQAQVSHQPTNDENGSQSAHTVSDQEEVRKDERSQEN